MDYELKSVADDHDDETHHNDDDCLSGVQSSPHLSPHLSPLTSPLTSPCGGDSTDYYIGYETDDLLSVTGIYYNTWMYEKVSIFRCGPIAVARRRSVRQHM